MFQGAIKAEFTDRNYLTILGVMVGNYSLQKEEFENCVMTEEVMDKLIDEDAFEFFLEETTIN